MSLKNPQERKNSENKKSSEKFISNLFHAKTIFLLEKYINVYLFS